jgi:hypothetical protein
MTGHEASHLVGKDRGWSGRVEDEALLRGAGRYSDDLHAAHVLQWVRKPDKSAKVS